MLDNKETKRLQGIHLIKHTYLSMKFWVSIKDLLLLLLLFTIFKKHLPNFSFIQY